MDAARDRPGVSTFVIAEAGVNHNGDLALALRLVEAAAAAGADAVKFQTFSADRLVTREAAKAAYQKQGEGDEDTQHDMLRRLEMDEQMHHALLAQCTRLGIEFMSTGFDEISVDMLAALGVRRFKVPSGELTNLPFLRHVARLGRPAIVSTGMATLDEVREALQAMTAAGLSLDQITVLHCTTAYPTPIEHVNLRAMLTLRAACGVDVGYSDHTAGTEVAVAAVALGATVIEKHLTLDHAMPGPDHAASLEPSAFATMVRAIRVVECALGSDTKLITASEHDNVRVARKSIVAACPIRAGEVLTPQNVTAKRPGGGLSPMRWDAVIGRRAPRDFAVDEWIEL